MTEQYKFLIEQPASEDAYESGSHKRIATSVIETLQANDEMNVIGIEGDLGSGKSTVINLLQEQCDPDSFELVFFDVEKYQHGATKKALIETLHARLKENLAQESARKIKKAKDIALGNHLKYDVVVGSHISGWVVSFATSLIFAASLIDEALIGLSYFFKFLAASFGWVDIPASNYDFDLLGFTSVVVALSPLAIYIMSAKEISFFGFSPPKAGNLFKRNGTDTVEETFEINREVGAYELQEALKEFIKYIPQDKRYILVIDNIDRVTDDKLREVWSDIDVFSSIAHDKIKLLIPYSHIHVAKALCSEGFSIGNDDGREFISKRLPITFRVSPIITADWKAHFEEMLEDAVNGLDKKTKSIIIKIISLLSSSNKKITPRYLKCLINSVVSTMLIKIEGVSVVSAFLYQLTVLERNLTLDSVLNRQLDTGTQELSKQDEGLKLAFEKALASIEKVLSFEQWSKDLVAIHYQAPYEIAESELLTTPLTAGLENGDAEPFLQKNGIFGYDRIVEELLSEHSWEECFKLASAMVSDSENEKAAQWVESWLPTINQLAKTDDFGIQDDILERISEARNLIDAGYDVDLIRFEEQFKTLDVPSPEAKITELYELSILLEKRPKVISSLRAESFNEILWPSREKLRRWEIESLELTEKLTLEILSLYEDESLPVDLSLHILSKYRLGWGGDDRKLPATSIETSAMEDLETPGDLTALLVSADWREPATFGVYKSHGINLPSGDLKTAWYAQAIGLAIALNNIELIKQLPSDVEVNDVFTNELTNVLAFHCSMRQIINALEAPAASPYLREAVTQLIEQHRVESLVTREAISHFDTLVDCTDLNEFELAEWLAGWTRHFKYTADELESIPASFVRTAFEHDELKEWQNLLKAVLSKNITVSWWQEEILNPCENLETIVNWMFADDKKLQKYKVLSDALKDLFNDEHVSAIVNFDNRSWVNKLLSIIQEPARKSVLEKMQKTMHEYRTSQDTQLTIYRIFHGQIKIVSPEVALSIFESNPEGFDDEDLNFTEWTDEELKRFVNLMHSHEESGYVFEKLSTQRPIVRIKEKVSKEKTNGEK